MKSEDNYVVRVATDSVIRRESVNEEGKTVYNVVREISFACYYKDGKEEEFVCENTAVFPIDTPDEDILKAGEDLISTAKHVRAEQDADKKEQAKADKIIKDAKIGSLVGEEIK